MFGKILNVDDKHVVLENLKGEAEASVLNLHVVFGEDNKKIVGEIVGITEKEITIILTGEIKDNYYTSGVNKKPSFKTGCRLILKSEVELILGNQDIKRKDNLYIGHSTVYENYLVTANVSDFFANHFAIIGNTGSGKSSGVARILQNVFYYNDDGVPNNSHIVLFDVYGEYNQALENINKITGAKFKKYTTQTNFGNTDLVKIPTNFLEVDDIALLLDADSPLQIPIIQKALKLVYIFTSKDPNITKYKNDIIAKALIDIISSGKNAAQIRDQVVAILTAYNTEELNLDTTIAQPGYTRTLRQCMNIDNQGKMASIDAVIDLLSKYSNLDLEAIITTPEFMYTLDDLYYAMEFALISEGTLSSDVMFERANILKTRLHSIINSDKRQFFDVDTPVGKNEFIHNVFSDQDGYPVQIVNMNFNYVDDRFAKVLIKIFAKLFFNYTTRLDDRGSYPIHMIVEEAHRYVIKDNDINILGYNIFDRITKEGRKYGLIIGFITQRPSELSVTALSQCSNFLVFRMFYPDDLKIVSSMSANITMETIERLKTLRPGTAMGFGTAFKMPLLVKMDMPEPAPASTSVDIVETWFKQEDEI